METEKLLQQLMRELRASNRVSEIIAWYGEWDHTEMWRLLEMELRDILAKVMEGGNGEV